MHVLAASARIVRPLHFRDFRLLWTGMTVSLLGDGIYLVAIVWQVYELSDAPTALALVGACVTVPQVVLVLLGGAITDRVERRRVLLGADLLRGVAVGVVGLLAVAGDLRLWHLFVLAAVFGVGSAMFGPAFSAILPDLVPEDLVLQANALDRIVRPLALRFIGPAVGGVIVGSFGAGTAFLADAASFAGSIAALLLIRRRPALISTGGRRSLAKDVGEGLRFVRSQTWLLGTILASSVGMLFFLGPVYVLLPLVVKQTLGGSASDLGVVFAAGGAGAMIASFVLGGRGLPRRPLTMMYAAWAAMCLQLVGYVGCRQDERILRRRGNLPVPPNPLHRSADADGRLRRRTELPQPLDRARRAGVRVEGDAAGGRTRGCRGGRRDVRALPAGAGARPRGSARAGSGATRSGKRRLGT